MNLLAPFALAWAHGLHDVHTNGHNFPRIKVSGFAGRGTTRKNGVSIAPRWSPRSPNLVSSFHLMCAPQAPKQSGLPPSLSITPRVLSGLVVSPLPPGARPFFRSSHRDQLSYNPHFTPISSCPLSSLCPYCVDPPRTSNLP